MTEPCPLAVVMVSDPGPVALTVVRRMAEWCDLLLVEGTATHKGRPRTPTRGDWHALSGVGRDRLRVVTTDLGSGSSASRQKIQRDSALPVVWREPANRIVLVVDSDEFLDREATMEVLSELREPGRLGLVPLYGAIDRVARTIHCCPRSDHDPLRDPSHRPARPYLFPGPLAARAAHLSDRSLNELRIRSGPVRKGHITGHHVTMADAATAVAAKLDDTHHHWLPRVKSPFHLGTMLSAGVHHAGWWIAEHRDPERWLLDLAREANLRVAGPSLPEPHLRALRAWAEARLDPGLPDSLVEAMDAFVRKRDPGSVDFLDDLDAGQLLRPMPRHGHAPEGARHDPAPRPEAAS